MYLIGRLVKYSAVQFSAYSAVWIRPTVQGRNYRLLNCKQEKVHHSDVSLIPTFVTQLPTVELYIKFYSFQFADSKEGTVEQDDDPRILGSLSFQNFKAFDDSDSRYFLTT